MARWMIGLLALLLAWPCVAPGPARAQTFAQAPAPQQLPVRAFTLLNETDLALFTLHAFPPGATERGPDRLGNDVVEPGSTYRVTLGRTRTCTFDIIVTFADGSEQSRRNQDICRAQRITFGDPDLPRREVSVRNGAEMVLRELYASERSAEAAGRDGWGPDRLGSAVVEPGTLFNLRLRTRACRFALRVVWADDREELRDGVDICANQPIIFDRSTLPQPPRRDLQVTNRHLATVQELYVSASGDSGWGPDRLGSAVLPAGETLDLAIEGECGVDVRIVFPNGGAEERRGVDICATPRLILAPGWVVAEPGEAAARGGGRALRNAGPLPIVELYVMAPGAAARGADRLGAEILAVGGTFDLQAADPCQADILAIFRDGREALLPAQDICTGEEIQVR